MKAISEGSSPGRHKLEFNLLENAYDYLNSSIEYVVRARKTNSTRMWKFALLHISFCIELFLKERLRREHPLLIYTNIDKSGPITRETKTISWTSLLHRIRHVLKDSLQEIDLGRLQVAQSLRNQMVHYDLKLEFPEVYHEFANLLNFVVEFHRHHLRIDDSETLHEMIDKELWQTEDDLYLSLIHI